MMRPPNHRKPSFYDWSRRPRCYRCHWPFETIVREGNKPGYYVCEFCKRTATRVSPANSVDSLR